MGGDRDLTGVPVDLRGPFESFHESAKAAGYMARIGVKRNASGELVLALIVAPRMVVDAREQKRLARMQRG